MTKTKHAEVKQEHNSFLLSLNHYDKRFRDIEDETQFRNDAQLLADHDAEVERKARLAQHAEECEECHWRMTSEGRQFIACDICRELGGTR